MGQYWKPVNLDKREYLEPHKLGTGLKLWEQLANHPGTGAALIVLLAVMPQARGGGDLAEDPIIGRWAGDRVVFVGDYSENDDLRSSPLPFGSLYEAMGTDDFKDITEEVAGVIERELKGRFVGDGWKQFKTIPDAVTHKLTGE